MLRVKPFSDAYFKLIELLPDLREAFLGWRARDRCRPQHGDRADPGRAKRNSLTAT